MQIGISEQLTSHFFHHLYINLCHRFTFKPMIQIQSYLTHHHHALTTSTIDTSAKVNVHVTLAFLE